MYSCNFGTGHGIEHIGFNFILIWILLDLFYKYQVSTKPLLNFFQKPR